MTYEEAASRNFRPKEYARKNENGEIIEWVPWYIIAEEERIAEEKINPRKYPTQAEWVSHMTNEIKITPSIGDYFWEAKWILAILFALYLFFALQ